MLSFTRVFQYILSVVGFLFVFVLLAIGVKVPPQRYHRGPGPRGPGTLGPGTLGPWDPGARDPGTLGPRGPGALGPSPPQA